MHILICHNFYRNFGGEDAYVQNLHRLLVENGNEVQSYYVDNDQITNSSILSKASYAYQAIYSQVTKKRLLLRITEKRPDIVHIHNIFPLISPSIFTILDEQNIPFVQTIHNYRWFCPNGLFFRQNQICQLCMKGNTLQAIRYRCLHGSITQSILYANIIKIARKKRYFPRNGHVIALTKFAANLFSKEFNLKESHIHLLPSSINAARTNPKLSIGDYFIFIGRISEEKGVFDLIECFRNLPNAQLKIVGTGPAEDEVKVMVNDLGLKNVDFTGFIKGDERFEYLRNCRAVILPVRWFEMFPLVILEAFSFGKPVIAPIIGGLPEIIEDQKTGLLYEFGNIQELEDRIKTLTDDDKLIHDLGENALQKFWNYYSQEIFYNKQMEIYKTIINNNSNTRQT